MLFALVGVASSLAWIGWFALAPAVGFPDTNPIAVLNGVLVGNADVAAWQGWVAVVVGLGVAAAVYFLVFQTAGPSRFGPALLYGIALWLLVGAVLMPLLATIFEPTSTDMDSAPTMGAMAPTFMMLERGLLAPLSALIAWLLFGAILGLAPVLRPSPVGDGAGQARPLPRAFVVLALAIAALLLLGGSVLGSWSRSFELWVIDQQGAGALYIYSGNSLVEGKTGDPEIIDLGEAATGVGDGAGEMPHMIRFNREQTHAFIANRHSGHVYVIRVDDREIVASIDVGEEVHDVRPSPDGRIALASKLADKKLGLIRTDYETETFTYDPSNDLDLAALENEGFPDNQPVCALFPRDDNLAYVTLRGGGLYVVDARSSDLRVIESFDAEDVAASGCGAATRDGKLFVGWGNPTLSRLYIFDYNRHALLHALPVSRHGPDGHGLTLVGSRGRYLWMAVRGSHAVVIVNAEREQIVRKIGAFGVLPDMPVVSPTGEFVFLTLRGPAFFADLPEPPPLASRTTPGFVVFEVLDGGRSGVPIAFVPMPQRSPGVFPDPHAIAVVRRTP